MSLVFSGLEIHYEERRDFVLTCAHTHGCSYLFDDARRARAYASVHVHDEFILRPTLNQLVRQLLLDVRVQLHLSAGKRTEASRNSFGQTCVARRFKRAFC